MGDVTATVTGVDALIAKLNKLPPSIIAAAQAANRTNARDFAATIARVVPVDDHDKTTAHLVETLKVEAGKTPTGTNVSIGGPEAPYVAHLEFGHMDHGKHVPARPFWFTTWRVNKSKYAARVTRAARKAIKALENGGA